MLYFQRYADQGDLLQRLKINATHLQALSISSEAAYNCDVGIRRCACTTKAAIFSGGTAGKGCSKLITKSDISRARDTPPRATLFDCLYNDYSTIKTNYHSWSEKAS
jgi:hypothetical protein